MVGTFLLAATPGGGGEFDIFANVLESRGVVLAVLVVLVLMSLVCWFIIAYKWLWFLRLKSLSKGFVDAYWEAQNPNEIYELARESSCPESRIFVAGFRELGQLKQRKKGTGALTQGFENIERAVNRARTQEGYRFEGLVGFLGTTGSTAPFIGLFGTVWGIMTAFAGLGQMDEDANLLATVTPPIAEALVATAIGLLAAIPAVMAYNYFVRRIRRINTEVDSFSADYLNTLRRLYFAH